MKNEIKRFIMKMCCLTVTVMFIHTLIWRKKEIQEIDGVSCGSSVHFPRTELYFVKILTRSFNNFAFGVTAPILFLLSLCLVLVSASAVILLACPSS